MKILIALLLVMKCAGLQAQQQRPACVEDLDSLYLIIQGSPAYKAQITGIKKRSYDSLYHALKQAMRKDSSDFDCFRLLTKLFYPIHDNHFGFYQVAVDYPVPPLKSDRELFASYRTTSTFLNYPKIRVDMDSLERVLGRMPRDSVQGIYHYGKLLKAGLFRTNKKDSLVAVILSSEHPAWRKGQLAFSLDEYSARRFRAIYADPLTKNFILYKNEKFIRGHLAESFFFSSGNSDTWTKGKFKDYSVLDKAEPLFQFRSLDKDIQYLRLGNFNAAERDVISSQLFYDSITNRLTSPYLIVDLRNNNGGSFTSSRKFLTLLRYYVVKGKVFALVNNRTLSNGEQFALKLKEMKNVVLLGEPTNGMIAYGNNAGTSVLLPSKRFGVYLSDIKDNGNYLPFEETGVPPHIMLDNNSDWIEQAVRFIRHQ